MYKSIVNDVHPDTRSEDAKKYDIVVEKRHEIET